MTALNKARVWGAQKLCSGQCGPHWACSNGGDGPQGLVPHMNKRSTESSQSLWKGRSRTLQCKEKGTASSNAQRNNRWIFPRERKAGSRREAPAPHADLWVQNRLTILGIGEEKQNLARGATWAWIKCPYREAKVSDGHWRFLPAGNKSSHLLT